MVSAAKEEIDGPPREAGAHGAPPGPLLAVSDLHVSYGDRSHLKS
jgi:hypothetical protein